MQRCHGRIINQTKTNAMTTRKNRTLENEEVEEQEVKEVVIFYLELHNKT
jgi:hypothetical protein